MASTICGWCGDRTHMAVKYGPYLLPIRSARYTYMATFQCANEQCGRLSVGWTTSRSQLANPTAEVPQMELEWEPRALRRTVFPDVPEQIAKAASEAHACLSIGAYRGAVALARAVVEATAKHNGIATGSLVVKIDEMHKKNLIREITRQLAHEIREGGNEIAHGDLADEPMPSEDAEAIVSLMDEILQEVFQGPARMLRLRQSREEREKRNSG